MTMEKALEVLESGGNIIPAPYFSGLIIKNNTIEGYYILGQNPTGNGTTLRSVSKDGSNLNLGPGCEPDMDTFIELING